MLEKHPDKQPGNKKAAAEFIKIQRAYEILNDAKAKAAFDALQRCLDFSFLSPGKAGLGFFNSFRTSFKVTLK